MTTSTSTWSADQLGTWTDEKTYEVSEDATVAYAEATNDDNPRHLSGEIAPPVFAVVPIFQLIGEPLMGIVPPEVMMTVVHGEQDAHFHQPIRPGMTLLTKAAALGIHKAPSGMTVHSKTVTTTADGEPVNEQWMIAFFRGAEGDLDAGESAPPHRTDPADRSDEPVAVVEQTFDADQTYRYSEASGDLMPIHLDDDIARSVGLPGIIIHGLCTMAFNSRAIVAETCEGDSERLKRLAVRFSRPALPEQTISTSIWATGTAGEGRESYAFETLNENGDAVVKDGLAEVVGLTSSLHSP